MATRERKAIDDRETQILEEAANIERKASMDQLARTGRTARYEVRREGGAWAVYDLDTGRPARTGVKSQNGLTQGQAEQIALDLQTDENEAQMRAAALGQTFPSTR